MPHWLVVLAWISVAAGALSALIVVIDIARGQRQHMWIMNLVWPLTTLYSGPLGLWAYFRVGRSTTHTAMRAAKERGEPPPAKCRPQWQSVALGATHCGAGCTLGDLIVEWLVFFVPFEIFGHAIFGTWVLDYIAAFALGIAFQYFTIKPMRDLSARQGLVQAVKADSASLTAWQAGMYGWMAIATFAIFQHEIPKTSPVFWLMMQIAMLAGFLAAYPVNYWLISAGIKEKM